MSPSWFPVGTQSLYPSPGTEKHSKATHAVDLPLVLVLVLGLEKPKSPPGHFMMAGPAKLSASFSKMGSRPAVPSQANSSPLQAGRSTDNSTEVPGFFLPG